MKRIVFLLVVLVVVPSGFGQALPANPAPAPPPDPMWTHLQSVAMGTPVVIENTSGPPVHCLFAGVTDAYLFCNPPGNPAGVGFRFDRADVLAVDYDRWSAPTMRQGAAERRSHPVWIASMIAGGIIVGFCATRTTDAGHSAEAGLIGAAAVGLIGAPLAFMPRSSYGPPAAPYYGAGIPMRFGLRAHQHIVLGIRRAD